MKYEEKIKELFKGKKITEIIVDGYGITLRIEGNIALLFNASDGGYSSYQVLHKNKESKIEELLKE